MSSLIKKKNSSEKNKHLKNAFETPEKEKITSLRVSEGVRNKINALAQIKSFDKVDTLLKDMIEEYKSTLSEDELNTLRIILSLKS